MQNRTQNRDLAYFKENCLLAEKPFVMHLIPPEMMDAFFI